MLTGAPETASSTFRIQPLQTKSRDSIGFTGKNAIAQVGKDLLFLDGLSIKKMSGISEYGDVESIDILANIREFFQDSTNGAGIDISLLKYSNFFHYKRKEQIWCTFPTSATTAFWLIIDYSNRSTREALGLPAYAFFPQAGLHPSCFTGIENGQTLDVYGGLYDGTIKKFDTGTNDINTAIDAHATWAFGIPERNITASNGILNIEYSTACSLTPSYAYGLQDWKSLRTAGNYTALAAQDLTDSSWHTTGNVAYKKFCDFMYGQGKSFALKIRHNTASQAFTMRPSSVNLSRRQDYF